MGGSMGTMIGTKVQQETFKSRLDRIRAGGENTARHIHVGPVDTSIRNVKKKRSKTKPVTITRPDPNKRGFFGELLMIPIAACAGAVSVLAAKVVAFRYLMDQPFYSSEYYGFSGAVLATVAIVVAIAILLRVILKLRGGVRGRAMLAGLVGMALFGDLAILHAPEVFTPLYSADYVAQVIAKLT